MNDVEVIKSLETIRGRVQEQLQKNIKEYRAFLAIQKAIEEASGLDEIVTSLERAKDQARVLLNDVREYRALLAVEKSIADISDVLGVLSDAEPTINVAAAQAQPEIGAEAALAEVASAMANAKSALGTPWNSGVTADGNMGIDAPAPADSPAEPGMPQHETKPDFGVSFRRVA